MFCERCGCELEDNVSFCVNCGMTTTTIEKKRLYDILICVLIGIAVVAMVVYGCYNLQQRINRLKDYTEEVGYAQDNANLFEFIELDDVIDDTDCKYATNYDNDIYMAFYDYYMQMHKSDNTYSNIELDEDTKAKLSQTSKRYNDIVWDSVYRIDQNSSIVISEAAVSAKEKGQILLGFTNIGDSPCTLYARGEIVNDIDYPYYNFSLISSTIEPGNTDIYCINDITKYSPEDKTRWYFFECEDSESLTGEYEANYDVKTNKKNGKVSLDVTLTNTLDGPETMNIIVAVLTDDNGKVCGIGQTDDSEVVEGKSSKLYKIYIDGVKEQISQYKNVYIYAIPSCR